MHLRSILSLLLLAAIAAATVCPGGARAQTPSPLSEAAAPPGAVPAALPEFSLPDLREINVAVPRPVRAAQAALGLGRQRLALVVGLATVGKRLVVDSAPRDTQAVASALRSGGFVVMLREDPSATDLRASLMEFRARLLPGGVGFVYVTGLGAQVNGHNLLLARDAPLDATLPPPALAQSLVAAAVPLDEFADALVGTPESPRMLVVDAAFQHPALERLPSPGLAEPRLAPGVMALFGQALGTWREVAAVAPLPIPPPTDPTALAATPFARVLVGMLLKPRISGPEALRATRRALVDATLGQHSPWIGGDTDAKEEFAEATLLDGLIPRTPEEMAREGLRQGTRLVSRPAGASAGEQTVSEVLQQTSGVTAAPAADDEGDDRKPRRNARTTTQTPGAGSVGSAVEAAAGAISTVAGVASAVGAVGAAARAAEAQAVAAVATTAASSVGSVAGNAVALASRAGGVPGTGPARITSAAAPAPAAVMPAATTAPLVTSAPAAAAAAQEGALGVAQAGLPANAPRPQATRGPAPTDGRTERRPEGGERPLYVPRTNAFGYAEGDTFSYQVIDVWRGEVVGRTTTTVEQVLDSGHLVANGRQVAMDPQGRLTRIAQADGSQSQFEPCQDLWWSNPQRGEDRTVKFIETFRRADRARGTIEWQGSSSVGGMRRLKLPAGEFIVLPIQSSGWWYETLANGNRNSGQWSRTVWYSPALGHPVAIDLQDADRLGKLLKRERVELLHAQSARSAP